MTKKHEIYKCEICGNIVEVLNIGAESLVCCGQTMKKEIEKTEDLGQEKHLPLIEKLPDNVCRGGDGIIVKIGEVPHPMEEEHYIEWVEVETKAGKMGKQFLKPGDKTELEFQTRDEIIAVRVYCNIHGLWVKKLDS